MRRKTYVKFAEGPRSVQVQTLRGESLGEIGWYQSWRQHVFLPEYGTVFSFDCMEDIAAQVKAMNAAKTP